MNLDKFISNSFLSAIKHDDDGLFKYIVLYKVIMAAVSCHKRSNLLLNDDIGEIKDPQITLTFDKNLCLYVIIHKITTN